MEVIVRRDVFDVGEEKIINAEHGVIIKVGENTFEINVCGEDRDMIVIYSPYMLVQPLSPSGIILKH